MKTYTFSDGYTIPRVLNGCWQLSLGHSLNGPLDHEDILKAFYELKDKGFKDIFVIQRSVETVPISIPEPKNSSAVSSRNLNRAEITRKAICRSIPSMFRISLIFPRSMKLLPAALSKEVSRD